MRRSAVALVFVLACSGPPREGGGPASSSAAPPQGGSAEPKASASSAARAAVIPKGDPRYDGFEGPTFDNACKTDGDCHTGGCAGELCTAQTDVVSACDIPPLKPAGASCGCVEGQCIWWKPG